MSIVSFSEVYVFQRCEREYYYRFGMGLANHNSDPVQLGIFGHDMMQHFWSAIATGKSRQEAKDYLFSFFPARGGRKKTPFGTFNFDAEYVKAQLLVDEFCNTVPLIGTPVMIEEPMKVLIDPENDLWVGFTVDMGLERDGFIELDDYKFTGRMWSQKQMNRYSQLNLYNLFLRLLGYNVRRSYLKLFLTGKSHKGSRFREHVYEPGQNELDILKGDFLRAAYKVIDFKELPVAAQARLASRTLNYRACAYCYFEEPCSKEAKGLDVSKLLQTKYVENTYGYEQ